MYSENHNSCTENRMEDSMKYLSLKAKLTILYTVLMTSIVCIVVTILFSFSNQEILSNVGSQLEERVADASSEIRYRQDSLEIEPDFLELEDGIYLSLYNSDGHFLYGKIPYGFDNSVPFDDGNVRKIQGNGTQYYVLDMVYDIPGYGIVDVRGISSITAAERSFLLTIRLSLILLPILVIVTAILGYFMAKHTLKPVDQITRTVQAIQKDNDLSRRVSLGNGKDEIYRLARTFDQMLEEIEKSLQREQQFTSDVAHELRTPLSTMMLLCETILGRKDLDPSLREDLLILQKKIHSLSRMSSQLLMLSRADQGRAKIERERVDLSDLALITCEEVKENAYRKHISLDTEIAPDLFMIGDETLLIRFFINLLNNAISYGKENGHIFVSLHHAKENSSQIEGFIKDDGIGISESNLPHIWERFYQADSSRTESDSSGLGLSMVDWIVKAHHGTIRAESNLGQGTTFFFVFPASNHDIEH